MCGITGIWQRELSFNVDSVVDFLSSAANRGEDGYGMTMVTEVTDGWDVATLRSEKSLARAEQKEEIRKFLQERPTRKGHQFILSICRAHPSTEVADAMQPIVYEEEGVCLVHNGCVSDSFRKEFKDCKTKIDSEMIVKAYLKFNRDIVKVVEYLVGGFAFILLDTKLRQLYVVTDYKPLSVGYLRPYGFFVHSLDSAGRELIKKETGCTHDGQNVWENFYNHPQASYVVRRIDIDSGMEVEIPFTPRFVAPGFDSSRKGEGEKYYVLASGGIDSGLTAWVLNKLGYDVTMVHFDYGQKSSAAEKYCSKMLADLSGCDYKFFDVKNVFTGSNSSLINKDVEIKTGTEEELKSTQAWVPFRNAYFMSYLVTYVEEEIMKNNYKNVYICGGYASLEEEQMYPDNSERFISAFFDMVKFGAITGHRINFMNIFQDIMKYEEWVIGHKLEFPFEYTASCDDARLVDGKIELCRQCGSTLMSMWAAEQAGVVDPRIFYDKDVSYNIRAKRVKGQAKNIDVYSIVNRMKLPYDVDKLALKEIVRG